MKVIEKSKKLCGIILDLRWMLVSVAVLYVIGYLALPATPGNSPYAHPLGWWGWYDQGQYLKSAYALLQHDLSPDKHFYPPLYPIVGAFFLKWSSGHPYFLMNLLCLLWFTYVFIRIADRYVPRWCGALLLFGTTILNQHIFVNYLIPWTTTLSVALLSSGILGLAWLQGVLDRSNVKIVNWQVFFVAACLGLLVPTRPGDAAAVGGVLGLALLIGYGLAHRFAGDKLPRPAMFLFMAIIGMAIGPTIYFGFNKVVFGTVSGGYMQTVSGIGFSLADLPEKFVSLWLDGATLYGEPNAGLTEHYPWLFVSLAGLAWAMVRGDYLLRVLAIAISLLFAIYMPYGDLLPNGLWRYLNIHYFKWTFPFLALFAVLLIKHLLVSWRQRRGWAMPITFLLGIPFLLLSLHFVVDVTPVCTRVVEGNQSAILFELPDKQIDFVDFKGMTGGFTDVYFGPHRLLLDDRELKYIGGYRLIPMSWGIRLLFIRPIVGKTIQFTPNPKLTGGRAVSAQLGTYRFALGALKPFRQCVLSGVVSDYHLGEVVDFSQQGSGSLYVNQGWSVPEMWGRWSINDFATLKMHLTDNTNQLLKCELVMSAFVSESHPCQEFRIVVNEKEISRQPLCIEKEVEQLATFRFEIHPELLRSDGIIDIRFETPDSISPKMLGLSSDDRILGVGLRTFRLTTDLAP